ncbi:PLP-dependent aminotransferase family protein (plasmid) [Embleya sp. NBC_00888]|uniref:aminotransferase-like domain-containing protein n=1 Tax=Embleya sp. NBC_00888 TaxID=2975960 RepID=UPI002F912C51|nr:PLP-dependent aminotransferase family protein [Embleya sp. NBC_00888]
MKPIDADALLARLGRWSAGRGPLHLLLARRLRELVEAGELPPGARLPPERDLARRLAIGRSTLVAAYELLRREGLLTRRQGSGTWVAGTAEDGMTARVGGTSHPMFLGFLEPPDGVLQMACAAPDAPPPALLDAYRAALDRMGSITGDLGYHPGGHPALRDALARSYADRGIPTAPDEILVTTGAQQALALLVRHWVSPGDAVLVEGPTYPGMLEPLREAAADPVWAARDRDGLDVEAWCRTLVERRPAFAYLVPTFHNPTGTVIPSLVRRRLVETAVAHDVPIVDDEVLSGLSFVGDPPPGLAAFGPAGRIVSVGSLSKIVWGGLRIGWIRADRDLIARLARLKATQDLGGDVPAQLAAAELVPNIPALSRHRARLLRARHDHLCARLATDLPDWRFRPVEGGQTLWIRLPHGDGGSFAQTAMRHGVAVLPGSSLHPAGADADCVRISFLADVGVLNEAVDRLVRAWNAYPAQPRTNTVPSGIAV